MIEGDAAHIAYAGLPEAGLRVSEVPMGLVLGSLAKLLATIAFVLIFGRIILGRSSRLRGLRSGGRRLAVFAIVTCALSLTLQSRVGSGFLHALPGIKDLEPDGYFFALQWWLDSKLIWITWMLLIGFAFWAWANLRRRSVGDHRSWMMSGYFLITALVSAAKLLGILAGLIASLVVPGMADGFETGWSGFVYHVSSPAGVVSMAMELLVLVAIVSLASWLAFRSIAVRADRWGASLARHGPPLLALWFACFLFPWVAGPLIPDAAVERISWVGAYTTLPLAATLALLMIAAALLAVRASRGMGDHPRGETA